MQVKRAPLRVGGRGAKYPVTSQLKLLAEPARQPRSCRTWFGIGGWSISKALDVEVTQRPDHSKRVCSAKCFMLVE